MKIITWNMNFWSEHKKGIKEFDEWRKNCISTLDGFNADFILLQEVNPILLFGLEDNENISTKKYYEMEDKNIYYHELRDELLYDFNKYNINQKECFWGTCIIVNKKLNLKFIFKKDNINMQDNNNYYGRNGLMAYNFGTETKENITVINIYNKKNNEFEQYTMLKDMQKDLKETIDKNSNNLIILGGDFNGNETDSKYFFDFLKNDCNLKNCTEGIETTVKKFKYQDDYIFLIKDLTNVIKSKVHTEIDFSDHYPVEIEIE
jgi:endonuclease/exonuclease/phosphatase family metal-dependent hydrolase